jgi:SAM-dependent methyltransferase
VRADRANHGSICEPLDAYWGRAYEGRGIPETEPDYKISDGREIRQQRILSIGCGLGRDIAYLCGSGNLVVGVDLSPAALRIARGHGIRTMQADIGRELPFQSGAFDIVIAKDVLEHLVEPLSLMQEIRRLLKGEGYAVVSVPNHFYYLARLRILLGRGLLWKSFGQDHRRLFHEWDYMHLRFFTYRGFEEFLRAAGFAVVKRHWDFGTFAHYLEPARKIPAYEAYWKTRGQLNGRERLLRDVIFPLVKLSYIIVPKRIRELIVGLSPGLFCASFYYHCRKDEAGGSRQ